jgi:hypothetical protein
VGQANAVTSQVLCNGSNTTAVSFATVNGGGTIVAGTPVVTNSGTISNYTCNTSCWCNCNWSEC